MKKLLLLIIICSFSLKVFAQNHTHHVKHNMILYGQRDSFYVSHIVYKEPHNYQVILKIIFDLSTMEIIAKEMIDNPNDQFIYLLDHMHIGQINEKPDISGQIFRRLSDGSQKILFDKVHIASGNYSIIYFNEIPLSLAGQQSSDWKLPPKEDCHKIKCI